MLLAVLGLAAALTLSAGCSGAGKSSSSAGQGRPSRTAESQPRGATTGKERPVARLGHPVLGKRNAPVTMIEYGDYQ